MDLQDVTLQVLYSTCCMYQHLFGSEDDRHDVEDGAFAARLLAELALRDLDGLRRAALAAELSGAWNTASCVGDRRMASVPGDFELDFDAVGTLKGTGRDGLGEFDLAGYWKGRLICMRKKRPQRASVDFLAFLGLDGCIIGVWHAPPEAGCFWGWRGARRVLERED